MTHGFGLTKLATRCRRASFFAAHGYVVLTYTSSGFGDSGGCITLQSADYDVKSARQLSPRCSSRAPTCSTTGAACVVGTIGGSYGGGIQLPLAAADDRVRDQRSSAAPGTTCATPSTPTTASSPATRPASRTTLNVQGVFKQEWTSLFYASGNTQPRRRAAAAAPRPSSLRRPGGDRGRAGCPGYYLALCRTYAAADLHRRLRRRGAHADRPASASTLHRRRSTSRCCWCRDRATRCSTSTTRWRPTAPCDVAACRSG